MCLINSNTAHHKGRQGSHCSCTQSECFIASLLSQKLDSGFLQPFFWLSYHLDWQKTNPERRGLVVACQLYVRGIYWAHMSTVRAAILPEFIVGFLRPSKRRSVGSQLLLLPSTSVPNHYLGILCTVWRCGNWNTDSVFKQTAFGALSDNKRLREWQTLDTALGMRVKCVVLYRRMLRVCVCVSVCEIGLILCVCVCVCVCACDHTDILCVCVCVLSDW